MLAVCSNVSVLVLPDSWKDVIEVVDGDCFPTLKGLIVFREKLVQDEKKELICWSVDHRSAERQLVLYSKQCCSRSRDTFRFWM